MSMRDAGRGIAVRAVVHHVVAMVAEVAYTARVDVRIAPRGNFTGVVVKVIPRRGP